MSATRDISNSLEQKQVDFFNRLPSELSLIALYFFGMGELRACLFVSKAVKLMVDNDPLLKLHKITNCRDFAKGSKGKKGRTPQSIYKDIQDYSQYSGSELVYHATHIKGESSLLLLQTPTLAAKLSTLDGPALQNLKFYASGHEMKFLRSLMDNKKLIDKLGRYQIPNIFFNDAETALVAIKHPNLAERIDATVLQQVVSYGGAWQYVLETPELLARLLPGDVRNFLHGDYLPTDSLRKQFARCVLDNKNLLDELTDTDIQNIFLNKPDFALLALKNPHLSLKINGWHLGNCARLGKEVRDYIVENLGSFLPRCIESDVGSLRQMEAVYYAEKSAVAEKKARSLETFTRIKKNGFTVFEPGNCANSLSEEKAVARLT